MSTLTNGLLDTSFTITAYGQSAGGRWPHFTLRLNGVKVGEANVNSATPGKYTFTTQVAPDTPYSLQLEYDNDGTYNGQDLNLFVKSFEVNGNLIPVTDSSVTYDKGALDGKDVVAGQEGLYWRGALNVALPPAAFLPPEPPMGAAPPSMTSQIVVTAWGPSAGGYPPHFKLMVDGKVVGESNVTSSAKDYTFKASVNPDQAHKIQVWYDNDANVGGVDRNMFVSRIVIDGKEIKATSPLASYDIGAVDGKNVVSGQEGLFWGGALTFGVPEDYFGGAIALPPPQPEPAPTKPAEIIVNAAGVSAGGVAPHFRVLLDGKVIGDAYATNTSTTAYSFKTNVDPTVAHKVQIHYDNDLAANGQDRNLIVQSVAINGHVVKPSTSGVTYDKYALDGKDVIAGQELMKWEGALNFAAPSLYFEKPILPPPSGPAFYVAANGKDTWSGKLAAPNANGTDGPFASLERARDAMRTSDINTTYVREGTYKLTKTLELSSLDNGHAFKNYPGETPMLSGGERVTGFVNEGNGIYSAKLASASGFGVTVGGKRQHLAEKGQWNDADVKSGWFFADAASSGASNMALRFHTGNVSAADFAPGTKIQVFDTERMTDAIVDVAGIDNTSRTIKLKTALPFTVQEGATYRLLDNASYVNQVGEYAWRSSDGRLVIKPADANFEQQGVTVARLNTLVKMTGTSGITLEGLTFSDTTSGGSGVELNSANGNKIGGNHFINVGTGILLKSSGNNLVGGNEVEQTAVHGIELRDNSNKNKIYANSIHNIGLIRKHVAGIMATGADDNVVAYNDISDSPRYGISFKNWSSSNINTGNIIEYNRIRNTVTESADAGAIEILGRSSIDTGMIVRGNWIENVAGIATTSSDQWLTKWKGFGIYLDDLTGGVKVQDNFLKNVGTAQVVVHGGDNNRVENNFSILAANAEEFIRIGWNPKFGDLGTPKNNVVVKNVIVGTLPLDDYYELLTANDPTIDSNLVFNLPTFGDNDRIGNPLFTDAYAGKYSLQPNSPAFAMGIRDLAWTQMGDQGYTSSTLMPVIWDL